MAAAAPPSSASTTASSSLVDQATTKTRSSYVADLLAKNASFAENADPRLLEACAAGQSPKAFWLGCSDSRVAEASILQVQLGEVFVHVRSFPCLVIRPLTRFPQRNVANVFSEADTSALAALTFALRNLGVSHVLVVGHTSCGGCAAALSSATSPSPASPPKLDAGDAAIVKWITPIIELAKTMEDRPKDQKRALDAVVEGNVAVQVRNISQSEVLQALWKSGKKVWVHGLVYDLATGKLKDLGLTQGPAEGD